VEEAAGIVDQWLARPNVRLLGPGERHWLILRPSRTGISQQIPNVLGATAETLIERAQFSVFSFFGFSNRVLQRPRQSHKVA
jgi:hypothetical protein